MMIGGVENVTGIGPRADVLIVTAQVNARPEAKPDSVGTLNVAVLDVNRVLLVGQQKTLLDFAAPKVKYPDGKPAFQAKFDGDQQRRFRFAHKITRPGEHNTFSGNTEALGEAMQHHEAPKRVRQRCYQ